MSSETAICVYCGELWTLADGMCMKCQNGAKKMVEAMERANRKQQVHDAMSEFAKAERKERGDDD